MSGPMSSVFYSSDMSFLCCSPSMIAPSEMSISTMLGESVKETLADVTVEDAESLI